MLRTLNPLSAASRRGKSEPTPTPEPANELERAIQTLRAHQKAPAELAILDQEKAADDALELEIEKRRRQRAERRRELERVHAESSRARNIVIRDTSQESDREKLLTATAIAKQGEAAELAMRYRESRVKCEPPESTANYKELQGLLAEIAECDSRIKRENANPHQQPGLSAAEHRRRHLQVQVENLRPKIDAYAFEYGKWREIQEVKKQAADAFAERDRLRNEREDKAIAAALKGSK